VAAAYELGVLSVDAGDETTNLHVTVRMAFYYYNHVEGRPVESRMGGSISQCAMPQSAPCRIRRTWRRLAVVPRLNNASWASFCRPSPGLFCNNSTTACRDRARDTSDRSTLYLIPHSHPELLCAPFHSFGIRLDAAITFFQCFQPPIASKPATTVSPPPIPTVSRSDRARLGLRSTRRRRRQRRKRRPPSHPTDGYFYCALTAQPLGLHTR